MQGVAEIVQGHAANAAAVHHGRRRERGGDAGVIGGSDAFGREGVDKVGVWGKNWEGLLLGRVMVVVLLLRLGERRDGSRCGGCGGGGVERHGGGGF